MAEHASAVAEQAPAAAAARCWYTLDNQAQPVGPYSLEELTGEPFQLAVVKAVPTDPSCLCQTHALPAACRTVVMYPTGYASAGMLLDSQVFWKEGNSSWEKLAHIPELQVAHKAWQTYQQQHAG